MDRILIKGKRIIWRLDSPPIEDGVILIEGERIKAVGRKEEVKIEGRITNIDFGNLTLLPGLIDCHNHLSLDATLENYLHRMEDSLPELTLRAVAKMAVDLQSGVTTSRCLGDKGFLDVECKKAIHSGLLRGPRLLVATRGIRAVHGHGFVGYPFNGVEQIRNAVRENIAAGADLIKIYITGTLRSPKGISSYLSEEEIRTAVEEAHRVGIPVTTHCIGGIGLDWAINLGVDFIEHGYFLTDQQIDLLIKSERWLVMTPSVFLNDDRIKNLPSPLAEGHLAQRDEVTEKMRKVVRSGVKYAVGTDGLHGGLAQEIKYLVDLGATPSQALMAATSHAAKVCGEQPSIGTLETGKFADILGIEGNPLEDIGTLKNVKTVISRGRVVRLDGELR